MKKYILFVIAFFCFNAVVFAQTNNLNQKSGKSAVSAAWEKTTHDFGEIPQGVPVTVTFKFTNTGTAPMIISDVKPSCGCTTPSYTKEPVLAGKAGSIKVQYNAAAEGAFNKSITVISNSDEPNKIIYIKGTVKSGKQ